MKTYPCGPSVKNWLAIESHPEEVTPEKKSQFRNLFSEGLENNPIKDLETLVSIMDELLSMEFPELVIRLSDAYSDIWQYQHFKGLRAEGIAGMLQEQWARAEKCFHLAIELAPDELSSYINLVQIKFQQLEFSECGPLLTKALSLDKNYFPTWDLMWGYLQETSNNPREELEKLANQTQSWVAVSLLSDISGKNKTKALEPFFQSGERSQGFLVEYTGALGADDRYEDIISIVWQTNTLFKEQRHWKLEFHGLQATLAKGDEPTFHAKAKLFMNRPDLPQNMKQEVQELIETCNQ